jgi:hypothetical protein
VSTEGFANDVEQSLVRFVQVLIGDINAAFATTSPSGFEYLDIDSRLEIGELPLADFMGLSTYAISDLDRFFECSFAIAIATNDDANLLRLRRASSFVFGRLRTGAALTHYDHVTAQPIARLIVQPGTTLEPVSRAEQRPMRFVQASAHLNPLTALG